MPNIISVRAMYSIENSCALVALYYSSVPPQTIVCDKAISKLLDIKLGTKLTLFVPGTEPDKLLRIKDEDLARLKDPYELYERRGLIWVKGQGISMEFIANIGKFGTLCNKSWKKIGTWESKDGAFAFSLDKPSDSEIK